MENAALVGSIMGPVLLVMGLSLLFYANVWQKILKEWASDHVGLVVGGVMSLVLGLIVVNMVNVWQWNVWLIVTVSGWAMVLKGIFYFLAPGDTIKNLIKSVNSLNLLYFFSLVYVVAGAALSYYSYLA